VSRYDEQNPTAEESRDTVTPEAKGAVRELAPVGLTRCYVQEYNETDRRDLYDERYEPEVHKRENGIIVKRYAIDPLGQHQLEGKYHDILHPVERTVFREALSAIDQEKVVLVDMYAKMPDTAKNRADGTVGNIQVGDDNQPEIHTIALYPRENRIILLDPSNTTFSGYLAPILTDQYSKKVLSVPIEKNKTYHAQSLPGQGLSDGRDCISVALAMANIIKHNPNIPEQEVLSRVSNQPKVFDSTLSKSETKTAVQNITELPVEASRMHHSTDRDLRDPSSQFIREQVLAAVRPMLRQQQAQSVAASSSTSVASSQPGQNLSQNISGRTSSKGAKTGGRVL
jgi:hypothetical protein